MYQLTMQDRANSKDDSVKNNTELCVLYCGDHIKTDTIAAKKNTSWLAVSVGSCILLFGL
jgi:hypothetical protein